MMLRYLRIAHVHTTRVSVQTLDDNRLKGSLLIPIYKDTIAPMTFQLPMEPSSLRRFISGNAGSKEGAVKTFLVALVFIGLITGSVCAEEASFMDDAIGSPPQGWTATMTGSGAPKWTIETEEGAQQARKVLKQSGKATYPLILKDGTAIRNGYVEVRFKALSGSEDRAGGVVWRARDNRNYYVARANALENNVVAYKTVDGERTAIGTIADRNAYGVKVPVEAGQWHSLRVEFSGSRFSVLFNGRHVFDAEDATFPDAGQVGLWTKADSVTLFDGFSWGEQR